MKKKFVKKSKFKPKSKPKIKSTIKTKTKPKPKIKLKKLKESKGMPEAETNGEQDSPRTEKYTSSSAIRNETAPENQEISFNAIKNYPIERRYILLKPISNSVKDTFRRILGRR